MRVISSAYSTELYNTRPNSISPVAQLLITTITPLRPFSSDPKTQLNSKALPYTYHTAVTIVMLLYRHIHSNAYCNNSIVMQYDCYVTMEMQRTYCYATGTITLL
jgi:hypothetical protein